MSCAAKIKLERHDDESAQLDKPINELVHIASQSLKQQAENEIDDVLCLIHDAVIAIDQNKPVPEEVSQWLVNGLFDHIQTGKALEDCLRLRQGTRQTARTRYLLERRNEALCELFSLMSGNNATQKAKVLSGTLERFQTTTWNRWQDRSDRPENLSPIKQLCFEIFDYRLGVPLTSRKLYELTCRGPRVGNLYD